MRVPQPEGTRGSLKWLQRAVARRPDLLQPQGLPVIRWLSPLAEDDFAEYRDASFLKLLGLAHLTPALAVFWPARGPQWDALGLCAAGPVLVEAKAHLGEFNSPASQAGAVSMARIRAAFAAMQADLGLAPGADWTRSTYQYANRLAHLWWLRLQGVDAHLLFVSFIGDEERQGPRSADAWHLAFRDADRQLGIPQDHPILRNVHHVLPDVVALI